MNGIRYPGSQFVKIILNAAYNWIERNLWANHMIGHEAAQCFHNNLITRNLY